MILTVGALAWLSGRPGFPGKPPGADTARVPCAELPRAVFERGEYRGSRVMVSFELPLTATADPLVWEYRPGIPADITAPTYRIHFERPPHPGSNLPVVVVGTVQGIDPDSRVRLNRVPGAVLLTGATVDLPTSP